MADDDLTGEIIHLISAVTFPYTVVDELGASAIGLVSIDVIVNTPPVIVSNQTTVAGSEGVSLVNSGTWSDIGDTVTLVASEGHRGIGNAVRYAIRGQMP